jgi:oligoribonuclease NrnB/cAMP/cGMP phosphodiesterase (DHH superfamily)
MPFVKNQLSSTSTQAPMIDQTLAHGEGSFPRLPEITVNDIARQGGDRPSTSFLVYHQSKSGTDCPDGVMAAAIANWYLASPVIIPDWYRHKDEYEPTPDFGRYPFISGDRLCIVDFSYPAHWLRYWENKGVRIVLMDHHEPKFEELRQFPWAILSADDCGATLAWKHFAGVESIPQLLLHVQRRDTGKDGYYKGPPYSGEILKSRRINEALGEIRREFQGRPKRSLLISLMMTLRDTIEDPGRLGQLEAQGESLLDKRMAVCRIAVRRGILAKFPVPNGGPGDYVTTVVVQTSEAEDFCHSDIGSLALQEFEDDAPMALIVTSDGGCHLRSFGDFDTSPYARRYGGNGHINASGFSLPGSELRRLLEAWVVGRSQMAALEKARHGENMGEHELGLLSTALQSLPGAGKLDGDNFSPGPLLFKLFEGTDEST